MLKKLIGAAAGTGLVLTMAGTAFAHPWMWMKPKIEVDNENTTVTTTAVNLANSGGVAVMAGEVEHFGHTGNTSAALNVQNVVNWTEIGTCGLCSRKKIEVDNKNTTVTTRGINVANSGGMAGGFMSHPEVEHFGHTGNTSASFVVGNQVNTVMVGVDL